jgi:hypothetical protein
MQTVANGIPVRLPMRRTARRHHHQPNQTDGPQYPLEVRHCLQCSIDWRTRSSFARIDWTNQVSQFHLNPTFSHGGCRYSLIIETAYIGITSQKGIESMLKLIYRAQAFRYLCLCEQKLQIASQCPVHAR